jgi:hypothetical protein
MSIPVLVEPVGQRYRASTGSPLMLATEADTADLAVSELQKLYQQKINNGCEIRAIYFTEDDAIRQQIQAIRAAARNMSETPMLREWQAAREEYRQEQERLAIVEP